MIEAAGSGFLIAVLWMDLIFDVQVLPHRRSAEIPEPALASIAGYYRRATTTSRPMSLLIAAVMVILLAALTFHAVEGSDPAWLTAVFAVLAAGPVLLPCCAPCPTRWPWARAGTARPTRPGWPVPCAATT
ncbi:hypothetical protein [Mycolicibacterium neworleansense]|uniref:Uncharacterized protein n=1 Tax=Mycolicibacterium neworleansense TaxID=146018 RepID=A0A0H5RL43_9MYCO|nr:hypothetical protein [Mycolicibacterium neworleansense]CRZ14217.1 hypothetical protein BN2156_01065 [Mycolicibacterium neworleansense]